MILEHRRRVDVGLPVGRDGILHLAVNFPEITVVGLRVGSPDNEEVLLVLLALGPSLSVPRRHFKQDLHQRGCFSLFRSNSKHSSGLCHISLFQLGQYLPGSLPGTSPPLPPFLSNVAVNVSTFFERQALVSVSVALVIVREELYFPSSSNNPLPVTATPARLPKQPSKSSTVARVGCAAGGSFLPPAPPSAVLPNCPAYFPPACIWMISFMSDFL